jgi:hypothetical protein
MCSDVKDGRCDVEALGFGVLVKWYEKWTCPQTASLKLGPLWKGYPKNSTLSAQRTQSLQLKQKI